jgi:hypothetical protein
MSVKLDSLWVTRCKAAGVHFLCSLVVLSAAAFVLFFEWFPYPYWSLAGGKRLIEIIFMVDLVLGPLLTLLLFDIRKTKPALALDMALIIILQIGAMSYGLHSAFVARPVYLVYEVDRFVVVTAADVDPNDLVKAEADFQQLPRRGIKKIGVRDPQSAEERTTSFELALAGKDVSLRPVYWKQFDEASKQQLRQRMRSLTELNARGEREKNLITDFLKGQREQIDAFYYIPVVFREQVWSAVLFDSTLEIAGYLPIDGF